MERVQDLINKLIEQKQHNESITQMLATVHLLQEELMLLQKSKGSGSAKVAVVLPSNKVTNTVSINVQKPLKQDEKPSMPDEELPLIAVEKLLPKKEENGNYILHPPFNQEAFSEPASSNHAQPSLYDFHFDALSEAPTLVHQQPRKEIHELIGEQKESLNDKLKQETRELGHVLKETPIKDLRKAIGLNDRFSFINELFRGDEVMYERSIKTINNFHILPEAEYWINRELKVKLGWNDNKELVQHFYHLIRRRFM